MNTDILIPIHLSREFADADKCFERCVEGVCQNTKDFRIIFVDDCSDAVGKLLIEDVVAKLPNSILLRTYKQRFFTRAVNLGLRLVNTECVVVLNSDTVPHQGWLEELYSVADEASKIARVGLVGSVYSPEDPRRWISSVGQDYVTGHCWLLNMGAMREVANTRGTPNQVLDELRPDAIHIRSDVYVCWDLNRLRWQTIKSHHSHVDHESGKSWGQQLHRIPNDLRFVNDSY